MLTLALPPLRERLADLPLLVERLLEDIGTRLGQAIEIDAEALHVLAAYRWPGNVRELKNVLERALLKHDTTRLAAADFADVLPRATTAAAPSADGGASHRPPPTPGAVQPLSAAVDAAERQAISAALAASGGNKVAAAHSLGISRAALYQKLEALGLR